MFIYYYYTLCPKEKHLEHSYYHYTLRLIKAAELYVLYSTENCVLNNLRFCRLQWLKTKPYPRVKSAKT